jgi:hypothetical protein
MKVYLNFKFLLILIFLSSSCSKKVYTQSDCEELSMKKFKGYQRESHIFDNNCKKFDIHYTSSRCQKALKDMILGSSLKSLKATYGPKIDQCFTENDLNKFQKKD